VNRYLRQFIRSLTWVCIGVTGTLLVLSFIPQRAPTDDECERRLEAQTERFIRWVDELNDLHEMELEQVSAKGRNNE